MVSLYLQESSVSNGKEPGAQEGGGLHQSLWTTVALMGGPENPGGMRGGG